MGYFLYISNILKKPYLPEKPTLFLDVRMSSLLVYKVLISTTLVPMYYVINCEASLSGVSKATICMRF